MNRERFSTRILFADEIQCIKNTFAIGAVFEEVFQANFLHEKVREFYRVANATSVKS